MIYLIVFIIALFFSFYFSGSEAGYISFNRAKFSSEVKSKNKKALEVKKYVEHLGLVLAITLLGNNLFNIIAITSLNRVWDIFLKEQVQYFLISSTVILLIFGEILPKVIFRKWSHFLVYETRKALILFNKLFYPFILVLMKISDLFVKLSNYTKKEKLSKNDFLFFIEKEYKNSFNSELEKNILKNISLFSSLNIDQIMVPITDLFLVSEKQQLKDMEEDIKKKPNGFIFVYEGRIDNIVSHIGIEDYLMAKKKTMARDIAKKCIFIPNNSGPEKIYKLLIEANNEILVVVNEKGGSLGVIKRDDLINKIFGFVNINQRSIEKKIYHAKKEDYFIVAGDTDLDEFNLYFKVKLPKKNFSTLNGFLNYYTESIPEEGEKIKYKNLIFEIKKAKKNMVSKVKLTFK